MTAPYFEADGVTLYLGDCREVIPALGITADLVVADPPYGETSLAWDRWPDGWPAIAATASSSMWCFGSMRMFLDRREEFADWRMSQDVVWQKTGGTGRANDRFRRIHEHALHWYHGPWQDIHHTAIRHIPPGGTRGHVRAGNTIASRTHGDHLGAYGVNTWVDDGTRLMGSIIHASKNRATAIHPTEKPVGILTPLIEYACPLGGTVLDPFAGSGSTLDAARQTGRRAVGIEAYEPYAERAARRLEQLTLEAL